MKKKIRSGGRIIARITRIVVPASLTALALICCEYFDPMDPSARWPREPDTSVTWARVIRPEGITGA